RPEPRADMIGGGDDLVDEAVQVDRGRQEAGPVTVADLVVGVRRYVVDEVVGVPEDGGLPRAEGRHLATRGPARDQLEVGVELAHGAGRLRSQPAVLAGGLVPQLPGAVHLVAEAPDP